MTHVASPSVFRISGMGNVDFTTLPPGRDEDGFQIGPFDLFMTARMSDSWSALAELVFENDDNEIATDLERFIVTYDRSNRLRVRAGREHNPLVHWNTTLHPGLYMQTPIDRPAMAAFEDDGGAWPVHFVGLLVSGRLQGRLGLSYGAGVGNGRGISRETVQVTSDADRSRAGLSWLGLAPSSVIGLEVYATAYLDDIPASDGTPRERDLTVGGDYLAHGIEIRAEWGRMKHDDKTTGIDYRTTGWYVLAGSRLRGSAESVKPYLLVDRLDAPEGEAYLEGVVDKW
jgi:hypothetical protein